MRSTMPQTWSVGTLTPPWLVAVVAILVAGLSTAAPGSEIGHFQSPGSYDAIKAAREGDTQRAALVWDAAAIGPEATLEVLPKTEDYERFAEAQGECSTCVQAKSFAVGPNLHVGNAVSFKNVDSKALPSAGKRIARGLLRSTGEGGVVWTQRVTSPGAQAMRVHFTDFQLGSGLTLHLYTSSGEVFGPFEGAGPNGNGDFWSNTLMGDEAYIELRSSGAIKGDALKRTRFNVADVAHIIDGGAFSGAREKLASCVQDASCFDTGDFAGIDLLRKAVALMVYAEDGQTFVCSGGLVNDRDEATTLPYFLTANHCINTAEAAASLECIWRFQTQECGASFLEFADTSGFPRTLGADLLANRAESDFAFLRLRETPPAGSVYLGWTTATPPGGTVLQRISHPKGAPQSYSTQTISSQRDQITCGALPTTQFIYSRRTIGSTDGGSSGSPVIWYRDDTLQVVGQLYGACFEPDQPDICAITGRRQVDGRFATTYTYIAAWLDSTTGPAGPPPNDDFAEANQLSGTASSVAASNLNATREDGEPLHAGRPGGSSVWWSWTAEQDGTVSIDTFGSNFNTLLAVYVGLAADELVPVAANDDAVGSDQSQVAFDTVAGTTYAIAVDGVDGAAGEIELQLAFSADPPVNDLFANATALEGENGMLTASNVGAGSEPGEPSHGGNSATHSVWWQWTAESDGRLTINTFDSPLDTTLAVYTGAAVDNLTMHAENDDAVGTLTSRAGLDVTAGTTYHIAVDGYGDAQGPFSLAWIYTGAIDNDDFADAAVLSGTSGADTGSCIGATEEPGEPDHGFNSFNSVWWQWEAPDTGRYTFNTAGSDFDTVLAFYVGATVADLQRVAANDDAQNVLTSAVSFDAQAGTLYLIAVAGYSNAEGQVQLAWQPAGSETFTLDFSASPPDGGTVSVRPAPGVDNRYPAGTTVTLTATPDPGFEFSSWSGSGLTTDNPVTVVMDRNQIRVANFTATLDAIALALLNGLASADADGDGELNFDEARSLKPNLTQALFDLLDSDNNATLSRQELGASGGMEQGCACPGETKSLRQAIEQSLGDLFLLAIGVVSLLAWSHRFGKGEG